VTGIDLDGPVVIRILLLLGGLPVLTPGVDLLPGEAVLLLEALVVVRGGIHAGQPVPEPGLRILYGLPLCGVTGLVSEGVQQARGVQHAAVARERVAVLAEPAQD